MSRVYYGLDVEQGKKAFMGASEFVLSDKNIYHGSTYSIMLSLGVLRPLQEVN